MQAVLLLVRAGPQGERVLGGDGVLADRVPHGEPHQGQERDAADARLLAEADSSKGCGDAVVVSEPDGAGGELREDRLVFPMPAGVSWRDVLPAAEDAPAPADAAEGQEGEEQAVSPKLRRRRVKRVRVVFKPKGEVNPHGLYFLGDTVDVREEYEEWGLLQQAGRGGAGPEEGQAAGGGAGPAIDRDDPRAARPLGGGVEAD